MNAFERFRQDFQGKRVLILGLGLLGRGVEVAKIFCDIGCQVLVTDKKDEGQLRPSMDKLRNFPIRFELGTQGEELVNEAEIIIRNPAVPWTHPLLQAARRRNKSVLMDTSLFGRYFPGLTIGVTGTRGKTTTTLLIFAILSKLVDQPIILAGNATRRANLGLLKKASANSVAVMELSSWELQGWREEQLSPQIAVVTNIYPDHLNRYINMGEYQADKEAIFAFQKKTDALILNRRNPLTRAMASKAVSRIIWFSNRDLPKSWRLKIPGEHNRENAAAVLQVSRLFGLDPGAVKPIITNFPAVEHRFETLGSLKGITFINDTTSTTPTATIKALDVCPKPPILVIGGESKRLPLSELVTAVVKQCKALALLKGSGTHELKTALKKISHPPIIAEDRDFSDTVLAAADYAKEGDIVLLSPAFTSFAEFANEFERGERFRDIFTTLSKSKT
ncbi:MAG: UDP-N-acetylmuramoylalanine--D-glutamate ligase [Candidatus Chisholmbacteria bacterium RIFCSPLOWO2_01_FULL_49_14]|uniref:UDP-N-acetylmuramoylalanine--D-glutamate ligase n=1 Tax=Candidatus Chisholmbacteria bacterium RIFCSPLOWO2_01_FULL_49_14 TaxID=1797593 RepID=A0A1G1W341_9BACT|nr:MAG: UDP-N-acetylmuramoylalanine--D-glutamate ligase [Candidatus Chisholmbacteria bacterium RIFCSPLOWO2_01_FULL_49_14]